MGSGCSCCGGDSSTYAPAAAMASRAAPSKYGMRPAPLGPGERKNGTNGTTTTTAGNGTRAPEEARTRARERAVQGVLESIEQLDSTVPNEKWRRQFVRTPGAGLEVVRTIADYLTQCTRARSGVAMMAPGAVPTKCTKAARAVKGRHSITTLDLRSLHIGDEGAAVLAPALLQDSLVQYAVLSGNNITDVGAQAFVRAMKPDCGSRLRLLVLSDNSISCTGLEQLALAMPSLTSLERVELGRGLTGGDGITEEDGDPLTMETIKALVTGINGSGSLTTFVFKGTGNYYQTDFTPSGLMHFVSEVVPKSKLTDMYLQECFCTKTGSWGPSLSSRFYSARPGATTSPAFPPSAMTTTTTREVGEGPAVPPSASIATRSADTLLGPIRSLSLGLSSSTTQLSTLVLRFPLSDEAVSALARGIAKATVLSHLSLRGCDMSGTGLATLAEALKKNRTLTTLDISYQSNLIAHPAVLAELRSSSRQRRSYATFSEVRNDTADSLSSREEREHPLLPVIKALHVNRTLVRLIMLGVNICTEDIEELCSCIERSGNTVLCEVSYTGIGCDALNVKLESFLAVNRELCNTVVDSALSTRLGFGRSGSTNTLNGDVSEPTLSETARASNVDRAITPNGARSIGEASLPQLPSRSTPTLATLDDGRGHGPLLASPFPAAALFPSLPPLGRGESLGRSPPPPASQVAPSRWKNTSTTPANGDAERKADSRSDVVSPNEIVVEAGPPLSAGSPDAAPALARTNTPDGDDSTIPFLSRTTRAGTGVAVVQSAVNRTADYETRGSTDSGRGGGESARRALMRPTSYSASPRLQLMEKEKGSRGSERWEQDRQRGNGGEETLPSGQRQPSVRGPAEAWELNEEVKNQHESTVASGSLQESEGGRLMDRDRVFRGMSSSSDGEYDDTMP